MSGIPSDQQPSRAVIIAGMHRSGTSLTAGLLRRLGVHLGERLIPADDWNRHGYHEDAELVSFHGQIFRALLPTGTRGHVDWGWSESVPLDLSGLERFRRTALRLASARAARSPSWGFKDPRATLLLDFWDSCLRDARFVFVYRAPWLVADSMQRLRADLFRRHPEYAIPIWTRYNRCLLDFHRRNRERSLLLNIDALPEALVAFKALAVERLGLRHLPIELGSGVDVALLSRSLAHDPLAGLTRAVHPECHQLYAELEAAADLPGPRGCPTGAPNPIRQPVAHPVLSVIVPTHNDATLLVDALASLERAELRDAEVIVVDDGSTDPECRRILASLRASGQRILHTPNRGLASARNTGIAAATGRYLLPLDADNRLLPGFVETAAAILDSNPAVGVVHSGWRTFGGQNGVVHGRPFRINKMAYCNEIDACAVFRRSLWADLGGYHETMTGFEDWEFWLHAHARNWGFELVTEPGFEYRVRPESLVRRSNQLGTRHRLRQQILERHADLLREQMPGALRWCCAEVFTLLPARIAERWERALIQIWYHLAWEIFHFALDLVHVRSRTVVTRLRDLYK